MTRRIMQRKFRNAAGRCRIYGRRLLVELRARPVSICTGARSHLEEVGLPAHPHQADTAGGRKAKRRSCISNACFLSLFYLLLPAKAFLPPFSTMRPTCTQ